MRFYLFILSITFSTMIQAEELVKQFEVDWTTTRESSSCISIHPTASVSGNQRLLYSETLYKCCSQFFSSKCMNGSEFLSGTLRQSFDSSTPFDWNDVSDIVVHLSEFDWDQPSQYDKRIHVKFGAGINNEIACKQNRWSTYRDVSSNVGHVMRWVRLFADENTLMYFSEDPTPKKVIEFYD